LRRLLLSLLSLPLAAEEGAPAWRLGPSDFVEYEVRTVTVKEGKESFGAWSARTLHGHDLRAGGAYCPASPACGDLPLLLALQLPGTPLETLDLRDAVAIRLKGGVDATAEGELLHLLGRWRFASRGEDDPRRCRIRGGEATARTTFDPKRGLVTGGRVEIAYERLDEKRGARPKSVAQAWELRLKRVVEHGTNLREEVDKAIARGVQRLKDKRREDGTWEPHGRYEIGTTALVVLTLAACDVPAGDPALARALDWIFAQEPRRTYDRAVALMAVDGAYTPPAERTLLRQGRRIESVRDLPPERRAWCGRVAAALEASASSPGSWGYPPGPRAAVTFDSSNTQYAVLGLQAASRLGIEVREQTWLGVARHFTQVQGREGGRGRVVLLREGEALGQEREHEVRDLGGVRYTTRETRAWGSMACAAISSLCIAKDELRRQRSTRLTVAVQREMDELILDAWGWLDAHWSVDRHPGHPANDWHYYYLYSLERAAILDNVKRVGNRDWYFEGATELLARQKKDGSWDEGGGGDIPETCFALLFLKRATAPVTPSSR
jgi:hypothetical protein